MKYEMLSHTSEAKFRAYGATIEERFSNAALALSDIMFDIQRLQPKILKKVLVKGTTPQSLLRNWLDELLLLLDSEFFALKDVKKMKISQLKEVWTLEATLLGEICNDATPRRGPAVKGITYDEMEITDRHVQVVVDV